MSLQNNKLKNTGPKLRRAQKQEISRLNHQRKEKIRLIAEIGIVILITSGLLFSALGINLYEKTFINFKIILTIWLSVTFISTILTRRLLDVYGDTQNIVIRAIFNSTTWGGTSIFLFMALNTYVPSSEIRMINTSILESGYSSGIRRKCKHPYTDIRVMDIEKRIEFPCSFKIENYRSVTLIVRKGLFGFYTIENQSLEK